MANVVNSDRVILEVNQSQAQALCCALDIYSRLCIGQIDAIGSLLRREIIPMGNPYPEVGSRHVASNEVCADVDAKLKEVKRVLGYTDNGSNGIGHSEVHPDGHRAYEIYKVLKKALAENCNPHPEFKGVDYDGLTVRYTQDPKPIAKVHPRAAEDCNRLSNDLRVRRPVIDGRDFHDSQFVRLHAEVNDLTREQCDSQWIPMDSATRKGIGF